MPERAEASAGCAKTALLGMPLSALLLLLSIVQAWRPPSSARCGVWLE
jgi:hypothetical protein